MKILASSVKCRIWLLLLPLLAAAVLAQNSSMPVSSIKFEGNKSVGPGKLIGLLQTSPEGSTYSAARLAADLQRIEQFYHDEGFLGAKIGPPDVQFQESGGRQSAVIRVPVSEGSLYLVGTIEIRNAYVFETQTLVQMLSLKKGQAFSRRRIAQWEGRLEEAYHSMGYIRFRSVLRESVNETAKTVDAVIEITEGKPYTVGKISVVGDDSIDVADFKRHLLIGEGALFNPAMVNTTIAYLNQMRRYGPIFPSDIDIRIDDANGIVDLAWHLKANR